MNKNIIKIVLAGIIIANNTMCPQNNISSGDQTSGRGEPSGFILNFMKRKIENKKKKNNKNIKFGWFTGQCKPREEFKKDFDRRGDDDNSFGGAVVNTRIVV
jgi:hypothetical protein